MNRLHLTSFALLTALAAGAAFAGPLDPPVGPVAPTYKTLTEVEPRVAINATNTPGDSDSVYRITQPGSYYLAANAYGAPSKAAIKIEASNVTLDLNGFTVQGVSGAAFGIVNGSSQPLRGTVIKNGAVRGFTNIGIHLTNTTLASTNTLERLEVSYCATGVMGGVNAIVRDCNVHDNLGDGIAITSGMITGCMVASNTGHGINAPSGASIYDCVVTGSGASGITMGGTSTVKGTTVTGTGPANNGISGSHANISGCTVQGAGTGISISRGMVTNCIVEDCQDHGIAAYFNGSKIINNTIRSVGLNSVEGACIKVTGSDCVVESNNCANSDRGIHVTSTGSLIMRNTCSGNALNYLISTSNRYAQIIDITAAGGAAASGNSAASNIMSGATSDPNANYAY